MLKRNFMIPIGTSTIWNFNTWYCFFQIFFFKFLVVEIWSVYNFILKKLTLNLVFLFTDKILSLNFLNLEWNKFLHFSIGPWVYTMDKKSTLLLIDVPTRTPVKYEILTADIVFSNTFSHFAWLKFEVYTCIIKFSNSFHWQNIILKFFI